MRVLSPPDALAQAGVLLLPIRCAVTARLKGFEVLACAHESCGSAKASRDELKFCPASALQLAQVLSGDVARLAAGHGLKLWIPLSIDGLRRDGSASLMFDGLAATEMAANNITFELKASDILANLSSTNEEVLAALTWHDSRIAVSELSDFASIVAALDADSRISEVRLPAALCARRPASSFEPRRNQSWLVEVVECLHDRGLLASALGVSDAKLCQEVIVAGFDLIQGDLIGRPHSVEATVDHMVAALPFGRTLL